MTAVAAAVGLVVVVLAGGLVARVAATVRRDVALRRRLAPHLVDAAASGFAAAPATTPAGVDGGAGALAGGVVQRLAVLVSPAAAVARRAATGVVRPAAMASLGATVAASGLSVSATEVAAVSVVAGPAAALAAVVAGAPVVAAVVVGAVAAGATPAFVAVRAARRRRRFATGLADVLVLVAGALRAGFPVSSALGAVTAEVDGPVADEFARVAAETAMGRPLAESLAAVGVRMRSDEVGWLGMAVDIHHAAGGNLAEVVDTVAATITERTRLRREVATLTAEGRLSAIVLGVLPPAMGVVIAVVNPAYVASLFATPAGVAMVVTAGVAMVAGFVWMQRIVTIEV